MKRKESPVPTAIYFDDMKCVAGKQNTVHLNVQFGTGELACC
jgi:hypothetical protein